MKIILEFDGVTEGVTDEDIVDAINWEGINAALGQCEGLEESSIELRVMNRAEKAAPDMLAMLKNFAADFSAETATQKQFLQSAKQLINQIEGK